MTGLMQRLKNVLVGLLLLILSAYYVNSTMFYHSHIVGGQTVYHSHINSYSHTTTSEDGGHTLDSINLIDYLNDIIVEQQDFNTHYDFVIRRLESVALVRSTAEASFFLERCDGLRAPPIA